jgi:hypothetical protein
MDDRQPIATAPKDGTKIIGLRGDEARTEFWGTYYIGCWMTGRTLWTMNAEPETFEPTEWIPLPPYTAPAEASDASDDQPQGGGARVD